MNKSLTSIIAIILSIVSCNNATKNNSNHNRVNKPFSKDINSNNQVLPKLEYDSVVTEVSKTIFGENEDIIVKVDLYTTDQIDLRLWNKPNTTNKKPDLSISDGNLDKSEKFGSNIYAFTNGESSYSIEENIFCGDETKVRLFLRVILKNEKIQSFQLENKTTINIEREACVESHLVGSWYTPYNGATKIEFFKGNSYRLSNWRRIIQEGRYECSNSTVILNPYADRRTSTLKLESISNFGHNLSGLIEGENCCFVKKEQNEQ